MSRVKRIVVHCTDEPSNAKRNKEYYRHWFFDVKKWRHFGYHAVVYQDGKWEQLQPLPELRKDGGYISDATTANGAAGFNKESIHVAYVGGRSESGKPYLDTRTLQQKKTLWALIAMWKEYYKITEVVGHRDLPGVKKSCPNFDAIKTYQNA